MSITTKADCVFVDVGNCMFASYDTYVAYLESSGQQSQTTLPAVEHTHVKVHGKVMHALNQ